MLKLSRSLRLSSPSVRSPRRRLRHPPPACKELKLQRRRRSPNRSAIAVVGGVTGSGIAVGSAGMARASTCTLVGVITTGVIGAMITTELRFGFPTTDRSFLIGPFVLLAPAHPVRAETFSQRQRLLETQSVGVRARVPAPPSHLTVGRVSKVWKGGGEGSLHSRVVAPTPHGLSPAA